MTLFWDRQNKPIEDTLVWARMYEDPAHRFVALDADDDGRRVSTIWEGLDRACLLRPTPESVMIFSTMTFTAPHEPMREWLWHNEAEALEGHDTVCREFLCRRARPQDGHLERAINARGERT